MKLRKVEIHGFKSFGKKTVLEFPEGLSCIVGPNGSGKSNVIDAICFALGYPSRNLRAARAQELIHSGKASRGEAKVTITLKNDENILDVKRKVDHKGRSVYKVNSIVSSRDNLHDTLGKHNIPKDGYNIVMQNDIASLIEIKPAERRRILDDISGISSFEDKKNKALEELEVVERRISDTNLILSEKEKYLEDIRKDRELALQFQDLQDELREKKAILLYTTLFELENEGGLSEERLTQIEKEKGAKIVELARIEEQVDDIGKRLEEITSKILESTSGEQGKLKSEMGGLKSTIEKSQEEIQFLKNEIGSLKEKVGNLETKKAELLEGIKLKEEEHQEKLKEIELASKKLATEEKKRTDLVGSYDNSELMELEQEREKIGAELFEAKKALTIIEKEIEVAEQRSGEITERQKAKEEELKALDARFKGLLGEQKKVNDSVTEMELKFKKEEEKRQKKLQKMESLKEELEGIEKKQSLLYQEFAKAEGELKALEKMEEKSGESNAMSFVGENKKKIGGYVGLVKDLGSVDDPYKTALEIAAGNKANCIVVEDDKVAEKYITGLRNSKVGRATFLPLNKVKGPKVNELPKAEGVIGWAKDLIDCDKKYQKVFDFVFGNTLVVADIQAARDVGIGRQKMVTIEGDMISAGGAMTGGFYRKSASVSFSSSEDKKKDLNKIKTEIAGLQDKRLKLDKEIRALEEDTKGAVAGVDEKSRVEAGVLRERRENLEEKVNNVKEELSFLNKELEELTAQKKELGDKKSEAEGLVSRLEKKEQKLASKVDQSAFKELREKLDKIDAQIHEFKEERFTLQSAGNSIENEINTLKAKIVDADERIEGMLKSVSKYEEKIEAKINDISVAGEQLHKIEKKHAAASSESQELFKEQERMNQRVKELGENRRILDAQLEKIKEEANELNIKKAKIDTKLEEVRETIKDFEKPGDDAMSKADMAEIKKRVKQLETELEAVGAVNLKAVDLYEELQKQYTEIKEKNERLYVEKEKIYDLIKTIEEKKKSVFFDAFEKVRDEFEKTIPDLYPTSQGNLLLENDSDPFNSGLIIEVKPRGREGMSIDALSGGEKVLTAIAFLMATQAIHKSPFYILDEIDAPLDQENVLRLVNFLRARDESQFIMISHNSETVKLMDAVIGIHMRDGISQAVGVDMQMVEA